MGNPDLPDGFIEVRIPEGAKVIDERTGEK